jgi:ribosomal-protein-alanine N-acetyltransferase
MTGLSIHPADLSHAALLSAMHHEILGANWPPDSMVQLLSLPGAFALVATLGAGTNPVGYAICVPGGEGFDLAALGVAAEARRQGIGRRIVAEVLERAKLTGAAELTLEVATDNSAAKNLYEICGFTEIARRPSYYASQQNRSAQDAVILGYKLN